MCGNHRHAPCLIAQLLDMSIVQEMVVFKRVSEVNEVVENLTDDDLEYNQKVLLA